MSEMNDRLQRDGASWREQVDARHTVDPTAVVDRALADSLSSPAHALRGRFSGRRYQMLSIAAVAAGVLALGGVVLAADSHDTGRRVLGNGIGIPTASALVSSGPGTAVTRSPAIGASSRVRVVQGASRTSRSGDGHGSGRTGSAGTSTSNSTEPFACESAALAISVSSPVVVSSSPSSSPSAPASTSASASASPSASESTPASLLTAMTIFVTNNGTTACLLGSPAVQFAGATDVTASPTADHTAALVLAVHATATAELEWDGTTDPNGCASFTTAVLTTPGAGSADLPLDPPARICDTNTLVVHPLTAG